MTSINWNSKEDRPSLNDVSITYWQEGDCCDRSTQYIRIFTQDGGGGPFICLEIPEGRWAISKVEDLVELLNDFKCRAGIDILEATEDV